MSGEVPASPESPQAAPGDSVPNAPAAVPSQFGPGSQIVGYRLLEQIGRGGMAVVYRARAWLRNWPGTRLSGTALPGNVGPPPPSIIRA